MVSTAMVVLPVYACRDQLERSRPMGTSASITLMPVCKGTPTGSRSMIGAAGRSIGRRWLHTSEPRSSSAPLQRVDDAPQQGIAHRHVHYPAGTFHFIPGLQMPVITQQYHADVGFAEFEGDVVQPAGNFTSSSKPTFGKPVTRAMPVATLLTCLDSRACKRG
ncbi:MAG: hypothetical protein U5M51_08765 [Emticicia sp.]|nr:hypothetical protein [Emticicia sp.]